MNLTNVMKSSIMVCVALGGQTQEKATDEPTGQDDVPLNKVCGLRNEREDELTKTLSFMHVLRKKIFDPFPYP